MDYFTSWTEEDQIEFVQELLKSMQHHQHGTINAFLKPMLQRDFISLLPKKVRPSWLIQDYYAKNIASHMCEEFRNESPIK